MATFSLESVCALVSPIAALIGALVLSGCASLESSWYGCESGRVRPYDYVAECDRLRAAAIQSGVIRVHR